MKNILIYISEKYTNYLPLYLYTICLLKIIKKNITNNVSIIHSPKIIRYKNPNVIFLFSLDIDDVINYFHPNQIKYIINTEHFSTWNIYEKFKILNSRKNINLIEYNVLNINTIKSNFHNINCEYIPQMYHPYLINYYNYLVPNKISFEKKDIDVLFFGNYNIPRRQLIIDKLCKFCNVKLIFKTDNKELFNLIERSKIVLNIFSIDYNKPFDYYRNIFIIANKALLVSEYPSDNNVLFEPEKNISEYLIVPKYENIIKSIIEIKSRFSDNLFIDSLINKQNELLKKINMENIYKKLFENIDI